MGKIKILLLLALFGIVLVSCESNTYSEISKQTANPTYAADIEQIVHHNCISCHFAANTDNLPNLETYTGVKNACLNNNLICRIDSENCGERMPQGGKLPQSDIDLIKLWAANGFIEK
jgi:hypothetical protein